MAQQMVYCFDLQVQPGSALALVIQSLVQEPVVNQVAELLQG